MLYTLDDDHQVSITTIEEADQVIFLLKKTAIWLKEKNIDQWNSLAQGRNDKEIKQSIHNKKMYSVKKNREIVATFTLYQKQASWDIDLWGNLKDKAVYIHRLALTRSEIGSGLGKKILQWIETYTKNIGIDTLRLDCVNGNEKLNTFYINNSFKKQGTNYGFSLYEKNLNRLLD